jgi:hypothetical protein
MPELSSWLWLVGVLVLFLVIVGIFGGFVPRVMGRQCPKCLRRVPRGTVTCPACGATVTAATDIGK